MSTTKRKFKLYNNRPSQRIDEMSANDLQLLKTKSSAMANACGYADDGKGQNYWIGVEGDCEERLKELGVSICEYCKNENPKPLFLDKKTSIIIRKSDVTGLPILHIIQFAYELEINISKCPKCGRKL